jgi:prolipoprotein diacylglyceryltransferase
MENYIIVAILAAIVGGIVWYLLRAKKRGEKCIGCPYAKQCNQKCGSELNFKNND